MRQRISEQRLESIGFLLCALFLGLLIGWMGGTFSAIRNLSECVESGD